MLILILFAFLAGVVTVLSPCILPVLPIVLSGSVGSGKRRPLGVVAGFVLSFTFFTLFLSTLVQFTGLSANALRNFSVVVIVGFGLSLLTPKVQALLEKLFTFFSRFSVREQKEGFGGGMIVGLSLGLIWTPCVGPILASVISLALTGSVSGAAFLITLAYALGTGLPMLGITYGGRELLNRVPWLLANTGRIQKGFGVVMVLTGLAIFFNVDRTFQTWVLETFPKYGVGLTKIEENQLVKDALEGFGGRGDGDGKPMFEVRDDMEYPVAPELEGGSGWVNSEPLTLAELEGKVVLVDFWTYSCINCIRTLPYLVSWHEKYADKGLVIVGVHSPEFEFEKDRGNVLKALDDYGIDYPVVQDNEFKIWRAYSNRYWPAKYLVDKEGRVRYTHFGEGKYEETENKIRELLGEEKLSSFEELGEDSSRRGQTAETYLGYERAEAYVLENQIVRDEVSEYRYGEELDEDEVGLDGVWRVEGERIVAGEDGASLRLSFLGERVHLVMAGEGVVKVRLNGEELTQKYLTKDMNEVGEIEIEGARKYDVVDLGEDYGRYVLELEFSEGVEAYAFTFGS